MQPLFSAAFSTLRGNLPAEGVHNYLVHNYQLQLVMACLRPLARVLFAEHVVVAVNSHFSCGLRGPSCVILALSPCGTLRPLNTPQLGEVF